MPRRKTRSGWPRLPTPDPRSVRRVYCVEHPLGSVLALTSSSALFLQVIVNFLSSPSPKRVRWVGTVLTHLVQGPGAPLWPGREQAPGNPDPGPDLPRASRVVQPRLCTVGTVLRALCSQPLVSAASSTYWL